VHGEYERSLGPKTVLSVLCAFAVCLSFWILFGNGFEVIFGWTGKSVPPGPVVTRTLVVACGLIYFLRISLGTLRFFRRKIAYGEAAGVGLFVLFIQIFFSFFARTNINPSGWLVVLGVVLYILGSYLNTASEYQRYRWKKDPKNNGHLYTEGLFRYSRHINYFGDEVLFTGYALVAGSPWGLVVPAFMAFGFIFVNIPMLDRYLSSKYAAEFASYASRTKKFVPYVY
jgi:protein-S-isoprenylcysteine O-methyltransferase Ste14